jgi:pyruvate/2-oxoglutarate dehydrogenase complex dihydrolipoamide dehydrogenase (E3) component
MARYDAIIIGTGQAGPFLARRMAATGMHVAVIERGLIGGTCTNTGCTPTKTLVASAYAAHLARRAGEYGVAIEGSVGVDMRRVKARKDAIVEAKRARGEASLRNAENCDLILGHARFVSPHAVRVGEAELEAERAFINVGGRPVVPPIPGLAATGFLTNRTILDLEVLPRRLVIFGGSYIGLEFAQIFRRFGSEVVVVEHGPQLVAREDPEIAAAIHGILRDEGIEILLGANILRVEQRGGGIAAEIAQGAAGMTIEGSHLLVATGRRPNTDDLDLPAAGVRTDAKGFIQVDDHLRTNVPGIWALGDCNGRGAFTHTSYNDYEIAADNLLDGGTRSVADRIAAHALYIDPPLGRVGMSETEARRSGRPLLVGRLPMTQVARAIEKGETKGLMKIVVDRETRRVLGAAILGTGGDEVVHVIMTAMYADAPVTLLQREMGIHPTVSELIPTLLEQLENA